MQSSTAAPQCLGVHVARATNPSASTRFSVHVQLCGRASGGLCTGVDLVQSHACMRLGGGVALAADATACRPRQALS